MAYQYFNIIIYNSSDQLVSGRHGVMYPGKIPYPHEGLDISGRLSNVVYNWQYRIRGQMGLDRNRGR